MFHWNNLLYGKKQKKTFFLRNQKKFSSMLVFPAKVPQKFESVFFFIVLLNSTVLLQLSLAEQPEQLHVQQLLNRYYRWLTGFQILWIIPLISQEIFPRTEPIFKIGKFEPILLNCQFEDFSSIRRKVMRTNAFLRYYAVRNLPQKMGFDGLLVRNFSEKKMIRQFNRM